MHEFSRIGSRRGQPQINTTVYLVRILCIWYGYYVYMIVHVAVRVTRTVRYVWYRWGVGGGEGEWMDGTRGRGWVHGGVGGCP